MTMLRIKNRRGHCKKPALKKKSPHVHINFLLPVNADGDEVEYGGGGADDIHGQVEVANPHRQVPLTPVHLALAMATAPIPSENNVPCEPNKTNDTLNKF